MHRVELHVKRVECLAAGDTENRGRRDEPTMRPSRRVEVGELRALVDHVVDGTYVHLGTLLKCVHIWANGRRAPWSVRVVLFETHTLRDEERDVGVNNKHTEKAHTGPTATRLAGHQPAHERCADKVAILKLKLNLSLILSPSALTLNPTLNLGLPAARLR